MRRDFQLSTERIQTKGKTMKILLAVDGSPYTTKAVTYISTHLNWFKEAAELHLLHVKAPIPSGFATHGARAVAGDSAVDNYYREEARAALSTAETSLSASNIPFKSSFVIGDVAEEIKKYAADNNIDLIAMGSHGHSAIANMVMGSVATKVLAHTTVPVLIIR
jgi:nucleotide-binding universal stress UspA family protein